MDKNVIIRSFEDLKKDNYENLTYGELCAYDLSCDMCPFYGNGCSGGMVCYGGMPIEPPCCYFKDSDILQEKYDEFEGLRLRHEQYLKDEENKKRIKEEKSKIRKQKLREYRWRNFRELDEIKALKKRIKYYNKQLDTIDRINTFVYVVNSTNEFFRKHNCLCPEDVEAKEIEEEKANYINKIKECEEQIKAIKLSIKQKEKEFKTS